jgi:hypothetical protein
METMRTENARCADCGQATMGQECGSQVCRLNAQLRHEKLKAQLAESCAEQANRLIETSKHLIIEGTEIIADLLERLIERDPNSDEWPKLLEMTRTRIGQFKALK